MITDKFGLTYERFSEGVMVIGYDDVPPVAPKILTELGGRAVVGIEDNAFYRCESLEELDVPDGIVKIGDDAFRGCTSLKSVTLPKSVKKIGVGAFLGCTSLTSFTVSENNESYRVEDGVLYDKSGNTLLSCITPRKSESFDVPDSVTLIADRAFEKCTGLVRVNIPTSVTHISWDAFKDCTRLETLSLPNSIVEIRSGAFYGCVGLVDVTIPEGVDKIGDYAFSCCSGLTSITVPDSVTCIGEEAFGYGRYDYSKRTRPIEGFKIRGGKGSAAERYAEENDIEYVII